MRSSSGEGGLLAGWRSDAVVIPNPKNIHGNAAGGDWNGVCESQLRKRGAFQWQSVLEKTAGRDQVSTEAFGKGGMDLALAGLGKGTFSEKRSPSPMLLTPSKPLCSGMCCCAVYPSRSASSKEARFRLMAETRSGMSCTISSILPEQATSSRQRAGSSSTRRS